MSETRKLAAILVADVVGYSRLAGADEERTLARLRGLRSAAHRGCIVKRAGHGSVIEFRSAVDAVRCAIVQTGLIERNAGAPSERRIEFRVGIHEGCEDSLRSPATLRSTRPGARGSSRACARQGCRREKQRRVVFAAAFPNWR